MPTVAQVSPPHTAVQPPARVAKLTEKGCFLQVAQAQECLPPCSPCARFFNGSSFCSIGSLMVCAVGVRSMHHALVEPHLIQACLCGVGHSMLVNCGVVTLTCFAHCPAACIIIITIFRIMVLSSVCHCEVVTHHRAVATSVTTSVSLR